jgi:predicted CXXCH cytochrome family protein
LKQVLSLNLIGLLVLLSAFCCPAPLFGAVEGTPHDLAIGEQDACSACHVPFESFGEGLWPAPVTGEESGYGDVYLMCYYCHGSGGGANLPDAGQSFSMDIEIGTFSHGLDSSRLPSSVDALDPLLPYADDGMLECTTCHDVHDDTNWPFLRDDMDVLCARCHNMRQFVDGISKPVQGTWGNNYGLQNPGSHPMGEDVFDDSDDNSPVDLTAAGVFNLPYGLLGGHLIDGATGPKQGTGITCVTCHAVHGILLDDDPLASGVPPTPNLLVVEQPTAGDPYYGTVYNGNGDPRNALCEACHTGARQSVDAGTGEIYSGKYNVNPGFTAYSHPVDDIGASGVFTTEGFPDGWPVGSSPGEGVTYGVICESCHTPHPAANIDRPTILVATGTHILRATEDASDPEYICNHCHVIDNKAVCHPANILMGRMSDPDIGNGDEILTCNDCHFSRAHNWDGLGLALDPDWEPSNNARGPESVERTSANTSKECRDCHYSSNTLPGPTNNAANDGSIVTHSWRVRDNSGEAAQSEHYQDIGEGTHYEGPTSLDYSLGLFNGESFDATTDYWIGQGQANPRWSRFDGSAGQVTCESCHELEADKRVPNTALLLAHYNEGGTEPEDDPSGLCEGCHGHAPGGTGGRSHPMTGDIVSRTRQPLTTNGRSTRRSLEGNVTYPAADGLNCDSCHQPHDADTQGGTYIYESGQHTNPQHDVTSSNEVDGRVRGSEIPDIEDSRFCTSCHSGPY